MSYFEMWWPISAKLNALRSHPLLTECLLGDIRDGTVFPAIRNKKIDFYYRGRELFSFNGVKYQTHRKYAAVLPADVGDYVTQDDLRNISLISDFRDAYAGIKANVRRYSQPESDGISKLCQKFSFACDRGEEYVVLDIERATGVKDLQGKTSRIDLVFLSIRHKSLFFLEAKLLGDRRLWRDVQPNIVEQITRYQLYLSGNNERIITRYRDYVLIVNELFNLRLPQPTRIEPEVRLLVFDYKEFEGKRFLPKLRAKLGTSIRILPIGNLRSVTSAKLEEWLRHSVID